MRAFRLQSFGWPGLGTGRRDYLLYAILIGLIVPQPIPAEEPSNFSDILDRQTRETFAVVEAYIKEHPQASDVEQAYEWLFKTAREQGWEAETIPLANQYLAQDKKALSVKDLAVQVRIAGWAKAGQWEKALLDFERQLANVRLRMPQETVELAESLALQAQLAKQPDTARDLYRNLSRTLFLNPYVRKLCEEKLAKLELIGRAAPAVSVKDLEGKAVDLTDYQGKLVLLDFWATNCPPCLKEFPKLKRLYREYHPQGLEIIGISLDEEAGTVQEFQKTWQLPWRIALSGTDQGTTRDNFRAPTIPAMCLVDEQGDVVLMDPGTDGLAQFLKKKFKPKPEATQSRE